MRAPAVFTIPKRSVYIKSHFWTDVNKTAATFCFFLHFFVFAESGIVVLLQATHNTLPARSTALHIGRRQPKALYACRFPPALRDQTRRWYRDAAGQPMRNVNGRFALLKGIEAAVNLVLRNRIQRRRRFVQRHHQNQLPGGNALFDTIDHRLWYGLCGTGQLYPALKSTA